MASTGRSSTLFVLSLSLAILLFTCKADSNVYGTGPGDMQIQIQPQLKCNSVRAVQAGETCTGIAQQFKLTPEKFSGINPNLVCNNLFVGQWLCVNGGTTK